MLGTSRTSEVRAAATRLALQGRLLVRLTRSVVFYTVPVADTAAIVRELSRSACRHAETVDHLGAHLLDLAGRRRARPAEAEVLLTVGAELRRIATGLWKTDDVLAQAATDLKRLDAAPDRGR
jgi:hypothetical protein